MLNHSLKLFDLYTRQWFENSLGEPTKVQEQAWPAIAKGLDTLVSAPTGTGKTLSSFLVFIDRLKREAREGTLKQELQLIYISPLKSLAGDIRENLKRPLDGIMEEERKNIQDSKLMPYDISVSIRTGDTTQKERQGMIKRPPHILITTPESLYLMLTSNSGQNILRTAKAVIIDELHVMIDSKRGAHLMLSIARLERLCGYKLQRIGLSATVEPLSQAAEYLSPEPVTIVAPKMEKKMDLQVTSPLPDTQMVVHDTIWKELSNTVFEHCQVTRSVIAFVDGRAYAEKLAYYVNQLGGEGFARTHHGSLSKNQRHEVEMALRNGELRLLCATSSMELGIDVGDIDSVFQIGCPRTISSTMQRLGRAGHNPNRVSVMHLFPRTAVEGLYCGLTAEVVRRGGIEHSKPPRLCFDVLAQHLVSMAVGGGYSVDDVLEILSRAYPFAKVTKDEVKAVLCMLAGDYEHERDLPVRPRILYDRLHEHVEGDAYSRMLAVSTGGTIPDRGMYSVKTENGLKLGELEEEFVFESRVGDRFLLGTFAWKILSIQKDAVVVTPTATGGAKLPFWKGEIKGRHYQTGLAFGQIFRDLTVAYESKELYSKLCELGLDHNCAKSAESFLERQISATGSLPDDKTIIIEHFKDETGNQQMMVHSVFGRQVNAPLALLAREVACIMTKKNISYVEDDDGFLLFPYAGGDLPEGILNRIEPKKARKKLEAMILATPLFNINFRYNVNRALMMGVRKHTRQPLWVQRIRSTEMLDSLVQQKTHPLLLETKRECLEDFWDLDGVETVLQGILSGIIKVRELYLEHPSPMSLGLRRQQEANLMYDYAPTTVGIQQASTSELDQTSMISPNAEQLEQVGLRTKLPEDEQQLHSLLMIEGDLIAGEIDVPIEWLETLALREQAFYIEPGLWIAAEQVEQYQKALIDLEFEEQIKIVRRCLRYRGAHSQAELAARYFLTKERTADLIAELIQQESIIEHESLYYHATLYNRARQETIKSNRRQIKTLPASNYAALLASRIHKSGPAKEQLEEALKALCGESYQASLWESVILPARVKGYRMEHLDTLLSQGNYFWRLSTSGNVSFHQEEEIDWEAQLPELPELNENEQIIYDALLKRGASFMQRLNSLLGGVSPYDTMLKLAEKELIQADSFVPVRQWVNKDKLDHGNARQRVNARVIALTAGRWEITRPLTNASLEQQIEQVFDRYTILSHETAVGLPWVQVLEVLRVQEYRGLVRRGYYIEGMSGIQFVRQKDYTQTMFALENPGNDVVWLSAIDPYQPYGRFLPHGEEQSFARVAGTYIALHQGAPIAVIERQGKTLRIFKEEFLSEALLLFAQEFEHKSLYPTLTRITVKLYPKEAQEALKEAGFLKEITDFVLYRK
jgi:ATP-dependent Lhr-like helicase